MKGTRSPVCFSEYGLKDGLRKWTMLNCIWQQNSEPHKQPRRQTTTSKVIGPEQDWSRLPTSIILPLQGRKQSIAKRTSGTEKDHLIHNPEVKFYLNTRRWSAPSDLYFLLPPPKTHPLSMGKVVPILAVVDSELRRDWWTPRCFQCHNTQKKSNIYPQKDHKGAF